MTPDTRAMPSGAFQLRPATLEDVGAVAEVWHAGWIDGHLGHVPEVLLEHRRPADFLQRVPPRIPHTTVAVVDGQVAGFVTVHDDEVEQLFVAAAARGSGVASALLDFAERQIGDRYAVTWLAVAAGNARARRFYERGGWRDTGGFDYLAETADGTMPVPSRRYEKDLRG